MVGGSDLGLVQRHEDQKEANSQPNDEAADDEHGDVDRAGADSAPNDVEHAARENTGQASPALVDLDRSEASEKTADREERVDCAEKGVGVTLVKAHVCRPCGLAEGRGDNTRYILFVSASSGDTGRLTPQVHEPRQAKQITWSLA